MNIKLHEIEKRYRKFAVIISYEEDSFLLVRHRERHTWELPGGHHEKGEEIIDTARRELYEETGATHYHLDHLCDYSVESHGELNYGGLFRAQIYERGPLPPLEIAEVKAFKSLPSPEEMTYGDIQHRLLLLLEESDFFDKR